MSNEDRYYADLAEACENRCLTDDAELIAYQEHQWEQEDDR
ncbi:hypothetical protein [Secundilactobacillus kimchicus]|nr:hypothetical protein [Secundilactobacillus kimchicus]